MLDYSGVKCPVCGVPFGGDDDIVVCPECGAPYHRSCYQKEGHCIFQDLHEQGKEWQPPAPPAAPDVSAEVKDRECPICGTLNGRSALFCSRCGASLLGEPQRYNNASAGPQPARRTSPYPSYGRVTFAFDPMGGVSPTDELEPGVTYGDTSKLVKQNTGYYMPVFRYMKQTGRNKFNFCAFLFSGGWMLYRKQYKMGAIITAVVLGLYLTSILTSWFVSAPLLAGLAEQVGLDLTQGLDPSSPQWITLSELLLADPVAYLKVALPTFCLLGVMVVRIVVGILGNRFYLNHCVRTVRDIRSPEASQDNPAAALERKGGVNTAVAVCVGVCYFTVILPLLL